MFTKFKNWLLKSPSPKTMTDEEKLNRLFDAVDMANEAWEDAPKGISLWMEWKPQRRIIVQTFDRIDIIRDNS